MKYIKLFQNREEFDASAEEIYPSVSYIKGTGAVVFRPIPDREMPMYMEALEDLSVSFSKDGMEYSTDMCEWNSLTAGVLTPTVKAGERLYFRATGLTATSSEGIGTFAMNGRCNIRGNVMSLLCGDSFKDVDIISQNYAFSNLFKNATSIISAENLVLNFNTLSSYCYQYMFSDCENLEIAPTLLNIGTVGEYGCYGMFYNCKKLKICPEISCDKVFPRAFAYMFNNCISLTETPEQLPYPKTSFVNGGYYAYMGMFKGCSALTKLPKKLYAGHYMSQDMFAGCTSIEDASYVEISSANRNYCFSGLFSGCTSLVNAPELPATTLGYNCYSSMFKGCTSLVNAPELPATTLDSCCYSSMFKGCTSLVNAPELPANTLANGCYDSMFSGCISLVNAPELPVTTLANGCYSSMFSGCISLVNAPELPATTLAEMCYDSMFSGCTSLVNAPELPATTLISSCYSSMFSGCISLVNAPELPATTLKEKCYEDMFYGCTKLSYVKAMFLTKPGYSYTNGFLLNVAAEGTFVKNSEATWNVTGHVGIPTGWTVVLESPEV